MAAKRSRPFILGIAGGSGSGKSWLASYLQRELGLRACVVCQDWYYKDNGGLPPAEAAKLNFDHPKSIEASLLAKHLDRLHAGEVVEAPSYDYATHARMPTTHKVEPAPLIILEGLFVLCEPKVRERLDLAVYIDTPDDIRLLRRVQRDALERRVDLAETLRLYEYCVRPMHLKYLAPAAKKADLTWKQLEDKRFPARLLARLKRRL